MTCLTSDIIVVAGFGLPAPKEAAMKAASTPQVEVSQTVPSRDATPLPELATATDTTREVALRTKPNHEIITLNVITLSIPLERYRRRPTPSPSSRALTSKPPKPNSIHPISRRRTNLLSANPGDEV